MRHGFDFLTQAPKLLNGQLLQRSGIGQGRGDAGLQHLGHLGIVPPENVQVVRRALGCTLPDPVGAQDEPGRVQHVRVHAPLHGLLVRALGQGVEVLHRGPGFGQRVLGGHRCVSVDQFVALLHRCRLQVAHLKRLGRCARRPGLGRCVQVRLDVRQHQAVDHLPGVLPGSGVQNLRLPGHAVDGVQFGRHQTGAHLVVDRQIGRPLDGFLGRQFPVLLHHQLVGQGVNRVLRLLGSGQRAHQLLTVGELGVDARDHVDGDVRMQAVLCHHAQVVQARGQFLGYPDFLQGHRVEAPGGQRARVDPVARSALHGVGVILADGELNVSPRLGVELVLKLGQVVGIRVDGRQIPGLHQALGHGVDAQSTLTAKQRLAERGLWAALFRVPAPCLLHPGAVQAAQLGNRHEQRIHLGVQGLPALGGDLLERGPVVPGQAPGQELPRAVHRLRHHLAPRLDPKLRPQARRFLLQALQFPAPGVAAVGHVPQCAGFQFVGGCIAALRGQLLVRHELLRGVPALLGRREQRHHGARGLRNLDLLPGRQHPVEHAPNSVVQLARLGVLRQEVLERLVDRQHPLAEPLEVRGKLHARGVALEQVRFETLGHALVRGALLLEVHLIPLGQLFLNRPGDAVEVHQGGHVGQDLE